MSQDEQIQALRAALAAAGMMLLLVDSKRRDRFLNWTPDTTGCLERVRAHVGEALRSTEQPHSETGS